MLVQADARNIPLADRSVHCVVTSPPYFGLRNYGIGKEYGEIGLEERVEEYVSELVGVFREVWRILRDDGTLWVVIGDTFAGSNRGTNDYRKRDGLGQRPRTQYTGQVRDKSGLRRKNLIGVPWRLAFALQDDGWILRSAIVWHKPNAMPESVKDRPAMAHEYVLMLTKKERYFYDYLAVAEPAKYQRWPGIGEKHRNARNKRDRDEIEANGRRNLRSVWSIPTYPCKEAHFATFPPKLVETCILAGTSAKGVCPKCGAPWVRIVRKEPHPDRNIEHERTMSAERTGRKDGFTNDPSGKLSRIVEERWEPSCSCGVEETKPAVVLDPFGGSGTTAMVARSLGRTGICLDLNWEYLEIARKRCGLAQLSLV
jgi:DNA modification methylase